MAWLIFANVRRTKQIKQNVDRKTNKKLCALCEQPNNYFLGFWQKAADFSVMNVIPKANLIRRSLSGYRTASHTNVTAARPCSAIKETWLATSLSIQVMIALSKSVEDCAFQELKK